MIISRTPFRISLVGGGTDFPEFFNKHEGKVIGFAIDKYCNIFFRPGNKLWDYNFRIVYSKIELAKRIQHIIHPSVRNTSLFYNYKKPYDLLHNGDLPAKTGLGTSSSFTVGMCKIFRTVLHRVDNPYLIAKDAINIEQNLIKESVGSQDQIFASYGGFNTIKFSKNGFKVKKHDLKKEKIKQIKQNFLLMYTGQTRLAQKIEQNKIEKLRKKIDFYYKLKDLVDDMEKEIKRKIKFDIKTIGEILDYNWYLKKSLSKQVSNNFLDKIYKDAKSNGAFGGKLLGAGGGGFFLFIVPISKVSHFKKKFNSFKFIDFNISNIGSHIINSNNL